MDAVSIDDFAADEVNNLYRLWRLRYFPGLRAVRYRRIMTPTGRGQGSSVCRMCRPLRWLRPRQSMLLEEKLEPIVPRSGMLRIPASTKRPKLAHRRVGRGSASAAPDAVGTRTVDARLHDVRGLLRQAFPMHAPRTATGGRVGLTTPTERWVLLRHRRTVAAKPDAVGMTMAARQPTASLARPWRG